MPLTAPTTRTNAAPPPQIVLGSEPQMAEEAVLLQSDTIRSSTSSLAHGIQSRAAGLGGFEESSSSGAATDGGSAGPAQRGMAHAAAAAPGRPRKNSLRSLDDRALPSTRARSPSVGSAWADGGPSGLLGPSKSPSVYTARSTRTSAASLHIDGNLGLNIARSDSHASVRPAESNPVPSGSLPAAGTMLRAVQAFASEDADELDLDVGDLVELEVAPTAEGEYWWVGIHRGWGDRNGRRGFFPSACVQVESGDDAKTEATAFYDESSSVPTGTLLKAIYAYAPTKADEMELAADEQLMVLEGPPGGWWKGASVAALGSKVPKSGWFPASCAAPAAAPVDPTPVGETKRPLAASSSSLMSEAEDGIGSLRTLNRSPHYPGGTATPLATIVDVQQLTPGAATSPTGSAPSSGPGSTKRMSWYKRLVTKRDSANSSSASINSSGGSSALPSAGPALGPVPQLRSRSWSAPSSQSPSSELGSGRVPGSAGAATSGRSFGDGAAESTNALRLSHMSTLDRAPSAATLASLPVAERNRQLSIAELIATERDYLKDLNTMVHTFLRPMLDKKVVPAKAAEAVFSNVEQLLGIHRELVRVLDQRQQERELVRGVGDLFARTCEQLVAYNVYCSNYSAALIKLDGLLHSNRTFRNFCDEAYKQPQCRGLNLASFLIKPVQRICKYPLLLRDILRNTPGEHADAATLRVALDKLELVIALVNEGARQADGVRKLLEVQGRFADKSLGLVSNPQRQLVREDALYLLYGDMRKPRRLFLFSDMVLIARKDWRDRYHVIEKAPLADVAVSSVDEAPEESAAEPSERQSQHLFEIEVRPAAPDATEQTKRFVFAASTHGIKFAWLDAYRQLTQLAVTSKTYTDGESLSSNWDLQGASDDEDAAVDGSSATVAVGSTTLISDSSRAETREETVAAIDDEGEKTPRSPFLATTDAGTRSSERARIEAASVQMRELQTLLQQERERGEQLRTLLQKRDATLQEQRIEIEHAAARARHEQGIQAEVTAHYKKLELDRGAMVEEVAALKAALQHAREKFDVDTTVHLQALEQRDREVAENRQRLVAVEADHRAAVDKLRGQHNDLLRTTQEESLRLKSDAALLQQQLQHKLESANKEAARLAQALEIAERDREATRTALADECATVKTTAQRAVEQLKQRVQELQTAAVQRDAALQQLSSEKARLQADVARLQAQEDAHQQLAASASRAATERQEQMARREHDASELSQRLHSAQEHSSRQALELERLRRDCELQQRQNQETRDLLARRETKIVELKTRYSQAADGLTAAQGELAGARMELAAQHRLLADQQNHHELAIGQLRGQCDRLQNDAVHAERVHRELEAQADALRRELGELRDVPQRDALQRERVSEDFSRAQAELAQTRRALEQLQGNFDARVAAAAQDGVQARKETAQTLEDLRARCTLLQSQVQHAETSRAQTQHELANATAQLQVLRVQISHAEHRGDESAHLAEKHASELGVTKTKLEGAISRAEALQAERDARVRDADRANATHEQLQARLTQAETGLAEARVRLQAVDERRVALELEAERSRTLAASSTQRTTDELQNTRQRAETLAREVEGLAAAKNQAEAKVLALQARVDTLNVLLEQTKDKLAGSSERLGALQATADLLRDEVAQLPALRAQIAELTTSVHEAERNAERRAARALETSRKLEETILVNEKLQGQISAAEAATAALRAQLDEAADSSRKAAAYVDDLRQGLAERDARLVDLGKENVHLETRAQALADTARELQSRVNRAEAQSQQLRDANAEHDRGAATVRENLEKLRAAHETATSEAAKLQQRLQADHGALAKAKTRNAELQAALEAARTDHADAMQLLEKQLELGKTAERTTAHSEQQSSYYELILREVASQVDLDVTSPSADGEPLSSTRLMTLVHIVRDLHQNYMRAKVELDEAHSTLRDSVRDARTLAQRVEIDEARVVQLRESASRAAAAQQAAEMEKATLRGQLEAAQKSAETETTALQSQLEAAALTQQELEAQRAKLEQSLEEARVAAQEAQAGAVSTEEALALKKAVLQLQRQLAETQVQALHAVRQLRDRITILSAERSAPSSLDPADAPAVPTLALPPAGREPASLSQVQEALRQHIQLLSAAKPAGSTRRAFGLASHALVSPVAHLDLSGELAASARTALVAPERCVSPVSGPPLPQPRQKSLVNRATSPRLGTGGLPLFPA